ncbi:hypothetical protein RHMOL_Rhmol05G0243600 [Rhododendron molle]|uniref:Uncharacterized protein n=1 Tax=Rhododendron molle TaxID=49168 RepID=A0ACC0NTP1_RHOML|nr:hypothetical protein RHMOL_Rhmol05G0243600 [Rhododendron molle]
MFKGIGSIMMARLLKVNLLLAAKDCSGALSKTGCLRKDDDNNLEALLIRGHAYYYLVDHVVTSRFAEGNASKGKLRLAVEDYKAALAVDPNHLAHNVRLYLGVCKVLVQLGRGKDAVTSCTEVLDIDE